MVAGAVTGAMNVSIGLPVQVTGSSGVTHSSTLTVHTLRVSPHTWETDGEEVRVRWAMQTGGPSWLSSVGAGPPGGSRDEGAAEKSPRLRPA